MTFEAIARWLDGRLVDLFANAHKGNTHKRAREAQKR